LSAPPSSATRSAHAATVAALLRVIEASGCKTLAVIGLAKNAGKTTVVNALMTDDRYPFGLTSLGLDGELVDHLTGLAKPRISPPAGTLLATTQGSLDRSHYRMEVLEELPYRTPLGCVLIGRASGRGRVEVSGPTTLAELRGTIARLRAHGAGRVLVDGAINRLGSASPRVSDGLVLATGGMVGDTLDDALQTTAAALDVLTLPTVETETRMLIAPYRARHARVVAFDKSGAATQLELGTAIGEGVAVARRAQQLGTRMLYVGGALTQDFADDLARVLPPRKRLRVVVRDATVLVLPPAAVMRLARRGIAFEVLTPLRVLAVTANPFRLPRNYETDAFFNAVAAAVGERVPIFDVVNGRHSLPSGGRASRASS
jgi:hypothetical protein